VPASRGGVKWNILVPGGKSETIEAVMNRLKLATMSRCEKLDQAGMATILY